MPPPLYEEQARSGPAHAPVFIVRVTLASGEPESAQAGPKPQAQQPAQTRSLEPVDADHGRARSTPGPTPRACPRPPHRA